MKSQTENGNKSNRKKKYIKAINYGRFLQEEQINLHDYKTHLYENQL